MIGLSTPFSAYARLMIKHPISPRYAGRAVTRLAVSGMLAPMRIHENLRYGNAIEKTEIHPEPLFILGFARSGTTFLHNLFFQDPRLGFVSNYQALTQAFSITGAPWLSDLIQKGLPDKRPMDNVAVSMDLPQEEEIAILNLTADAPMHMFSFPSRYREIFDPYVFFENANSPEVKAWKKALLTVMKKATYFEGEKKPLVLKTPPNTARVDLLLDLFPKARFVYIHRDPYTVFRSTLNMYQKLLPDETLQVIDWDEVEDSIVHCYNGMIGRYLDQRSNIPEGQLVEITFEELEREPLSIMRGLYRALRMPDFAEAESKLMRYLATLESYEKNSFDFPETLVERVTQDLSIGFSAFGYHPKI